MIITYIDHSCFSVELEDSILIFDYYKGNLPDFPLEKKIYLFVSHNHHDHFNLDIFKLFNKYPKVNYIISKDIKKKFNKKFFISKGVDEKLYDEIYFIGENENAEINDLQVETLASTDEGVAFIINSEGKSIYHGGDLNWWAWKEDTPAENEQMEAAFKREIAKISSRHFHVAFLPLDPRQEELFYLGFDYFMHNTKTDVAYPMHFWGDNSVIKRLKEMPCAKEYKDRIEEI